MKYVMLCLFFAAAASAQTWKDGPHVGLATGGDVEKEHPAVGWQAAYEYNDLLSFELSLTGQWDEWTFGEPGDSPFANTADITVVSPSLSARTGWFFNPVTVYAAGGLGYYFFNADPETIHVSIGDRPGLLPSGVFERDVNIDVDDALGYHLGLGLEWLFASRWEVFAEYRFVFLDTDLAVTTTDYTRTPSGQNAFSVETERVEAARDYDHGLFRFGLNLRF